MKKNKTVKTGIMIAILLLAVGFAAVTTTLFINGILTIKPDSSNFKQYVVFANDDTNKPKLTANDKFTGLEGTNIGTVEVTSDGKTINFTTPTFKQIGEEITLHYHIKNNSQYRAKLGNVACTVSGENGEVLTAEEAGKYLKLTVTNNLNGTTLASNSTSDEDTIKIEMIRSFIGTNSADGNGQTTEADDENETKKFQVRCEMTATGEEIGNETPNSTND